MITSSGRSHSSWSNDSTCCNWAVGPPGPLVRAWHTAAKTSSPQTGLVITIPVCDGGVVLEHGGGGTVSVPALGRSANSSMARGGLVGDAFAGVIAGRLLSPSGCVEGGVKAQGEEGVVSAWDCVGCKIFPTSTSFSHFCKTQRDSSLSLNLRATHYAPSKHHMHPSQ